METLKIAVLQENEVETMYDLEDFGVTEDMFVSELVVKVDEILKGKKWYIKL